MKTLETQRLLLSAWRKKDAADLYEYAKNPNVGPHAGWKPHGDVKESRQIIKTLFIPNGVWAIRDRESGDAMKLYMGNSIFEKEILVNSGEYDRAKKLIEDTSTDAGEEMSEYKELAKQRELKRRTFTVYVLALIVIFVLLALVIK